MVIYNIANSWPIKQFFCIKNCSNGPSYMTKKANALLPQVWVQEIKRMLVMYFTHGLFLTCTQKSHYIYSHALRYLQNVQQFSTAPTPCINNKATPLYLLERASFFACGDKYPSTLVSGLPTTAPPLGFYPSHPFTPYSSNYIIYIDDINNHSRLCLGQLTLEKWGRQLYMTQ
jgi:hypothetical protein